MHIRLTAVSDWRKKDFEMKGHTCTPSSRESRSVYEETREDKPMIQEMLGTRKRGSRPTVQYNKVVIETL